MTTTSTTKLQSILSHSEDGKQFSIDALKKDVRINQEAESTRKKQDTLTFFSLCDNVARHIESVIEGKINQKNDDESQDYVELKHKVMLDDPLAIKTMKSLIEDYISFHSWSHVIAPSPYNNLVDGIFHENYGWGPLAGWREDPTMQRCKVIGHKDIWFADDNGNRTKQTDLSFRSLEEVRGLMERFKNMDPTNRLDPSNNTEMETVTPDGDVRITLMIPPRSIEPVITLRKQTVKVYNMEQQIALGTIPEEAKEIIIKLARSYGNSVIAGPPASGKTTMLMTFLAYSKHMETAFTETTFEMFPRQAFVGECIIHARALGDNQEESLFSTVLRKDIEQLIAAEIRLSEVEVYGAASERGLRKVMGSFHIEDPINIPGVMARLSVQHQRGQVSYTDEYARFADSLSYSIAMDIGEDNVKRITSIQFYDLDPFTLQVRTNRIMWFDEEAGDWKYNNDLPKRAHRLLKKDSKVTYERFMEILNALSEEKPMPEELKTDESIDTRRG